MNALNYYDNSVEDVFTELSTQAEGLTGAEAQARLDKYGKNRLAEAKKDSLLKRFFQQMVDPMIIILLVAAAIAAGMEIYNGKPIFYCLGDFIIQLETVLRAPDGMFAKQKLNGNDRLDVLFNNRSGNGKRGLSYSRVMFESVIPYWEADENGLTKLIFMPIEEQFHLPRSRAGWPRKECGMKIMEHFAEMSKPFGVDIKIENGLGVVQL